MKHLSRPGALLLALGLTLSLSACGPKEEPSGWQPDHSEPVQTEAAAPEPTPAADPYDAVRNYWPAEQLTQAWGPEQPVEHLFFHPIIAYPQYAFSSAVPADRQKGLDDWMVTVDEYKKILQNVYDKGYILVAMEDVWSEVTDDSGTHMVRNTLMLPEGKKPLIISFDDVNYYDYMLAEGFTSKLVVGEDGQIWAECTDPYTKETFLTQDLDATPILDNFVLEHPDFSLNGAKAIYSLTGYQGILGYRTQNDRDIAPGDPKRPEFEAYRQREIDAVKPVIARLKETGWTFGSHTWGHINLGSETRTLESVKTDTERWLEEVGSLWAPPTSSSIPTAPVPTEMTGTRQVPCSSISRAWDFGSLPAWASTPFLILRMTSPPSSATGSTRTEPPCAGPGTAISSSTTPRTSSI